MSETEKPVDRETLYNEVWTEPMVVVAPRYGLSDVGLAKICRSLAIPIPSRGYWAKVKAGRIMRRVPLPELKSSGSVPTGLVKLPMEQLTGRETASKTAARVRKDTASLPLPEDASAPHPLVLAASRRLRRRDGWPEDPPLRSAPKEVLHLSVTIGTLDRALAIADSLVKVLIKHGFAFEIDAENGLTLIKSLETGTTMAFSLTEYVPRAQHVLTPAEEQAQKRYWNRSRLDSSISYPKIPRYDFRPTGILTIQVGRWPSRSWKDTPKTQLELRLGEVAGGIVKLAQETHAREQEEARRNEAHRRAVAQYEFLTKRRADEIRRFEQLETEVSNWERAARLRAYADLVEQRAKAQAQISGELDAWLAWVRAKADWLDPLVLVSDPILDAPEPKRPPGYW
ncbi:MAG: hypothetical protein NVV69_07035 [Methyloversatilis sp.]|uniref:hypothetical protein n=1 Tax=Methyloversatilis sp. TaxID=2569862 RepID=UPI0025D2F1FA|nr:hypothetical protein [Methyloversatilis sp.]MCR6665753.1 hypothetical protein [Methyloversatilis sp.]